MKIKKFLIGLLLLSLTFMPFVHASQYDMDLTTSDANTGATMRTAINYALQALVSNSSGAAEPSTTYAYQLWADTTTGLLKIRNAANNAWVTLVTLSDPSASTSVEGIVELATNAELNTGTDTARAITASSVSALLHAMPYAINENSAVIASQASPNIGGAEGNFISLTHASGTTNITSLGTAPAGASRTTHFSVTSGTLTLVHNASALILPTASNLTVADGDVAKWVSLGSGNWRATGYMKADGTALVGATGFASTYAHAYRSAAYSPPRAVETKIALDAELYDPGGNMDVVTNNRYNVPSTGVYFIDGGVDFIEPFGDGLQTTVQIRLNGTTIIRNEQSYGYTNSYPVVRVSGLYYLTAGQYVELYVLHMAAEATRALDVTSSAKNYLRIIRVW